VLSVRHVSLRRPWLAAKFGSRGDIPCSTRTSPAYARPFGKGYVFGNGRTAVGRRDDALSDHRFALLQNRLGGQPEEVSGQTFTAPSFRAGSPVRLLESQFEALPFFDRAGAWRLMRKVNR
jgi:hypothetical protein